MRHDVFAPFAWNQFTIQVAAKAHRPLGQCGIRPGEEADGVAGAGVPDATGLAR